MNIRDSLIVVAFLLGVGALFLIAVVIRAVCRKPTRRNLGRIPPDRPWFNGIRSESKKPIKEKTL